MMEPRFVNRVNELKFLEDLVLEGSPLVWFVYGPEGCGKTRLLKEFVGRINGIAMYVDALERVDVKKVVKLSIPVDVSGIIRGIISDSSGIIGKIIANSIPVLIDKLVARIKIEDKPLAIIVDDVVKSIGLDQISWYIKWLYETIVKIYEEYKPSSILIIATTSEGASRRIVEKHSHAVIRLIWNLDKNSFQELARQFGPPDTSLIEYAWRLIGGNPRRLMELAIIYKWDIEQWIKSLENRLRPVALEIKAQGLVDELMELVEQPDIPWDKPSRRIVELVRFLEDENLYMYKGYTTLSGGELVSNQELGIGKYYAWQLPAYRIVLKELLR